MVTIKSLKSDFEKFFESHLQVNSVTYGEKDDLSINRAIRYPFVNLNYLETGINRGDNVLRFEFIVGDLSTELTELDALNNTQLIASDFITWLENSDIDFNDSFRLIPFQDQFIDRVSGHAFTVNFIVHRDNCASNIPK